MTTATRTRPSSTIPFGWELHPTNEHLIVRNDEEYEALDYVKSLAPEYGLQRKSDIIFNRTGKRLTKRGLKKVLERGY